MTCYAVIDTNVLVSALLSSHDDVATVKVVEKIFSGEVVPLFSEKILREYADVLMRKKFGFSEEMVSSFIYEIEQCGELVVATPTGETLPDMKDLPFYEVVMEKGKDKAYLVTGNLKHFPTRSFIVTARELLDILESK
ncbi:MAG: putative toxin-antitoxin system toxin component, PIN family [Lachnospiraceae bacterium]|nr:putative toxin-antitoxin system toxin component, PIN family [Lachnospiraceae bacterium]